MDDDLSGDARAASLSSPLPYKDRSAGLIVFGTLTLVVGCLAGLSVPLLLIGKTSVKALGYARHEPSLLPGLIFYSGIAMGLVWLGIGSIQARRWARALLLIFSWSWLSMGAIVLGFMAYIVPKTLPIFTTTSRPGHPTVPPEKVALVMSVIFLALGVIFIALPVVWTFFYQSRHVKATCHARDPVRSWTDNCPLPVLGLSVWLAVFVPILLIMPITNHGVIPFFGKFLSGTSGTLLWIGIAIMCGYSAWALYRLEHRGWWLMLVVLCLFLVSNIMTFTKHDVLEMYQLMGHSPAQIDHLQKSGVLAGIRMPWLTAGSVLPLLCYLFFAKRFLRRNS